jgi:hypothetical protein
MELAAADLLVSVRFLSWRVRRLVSRPEQGHGHKHLWQLRPP